MDFKSQFSAVYLLSTVFFFVDAGEAYFPASKVCCGDKIFDRYQDGVENACCGNTKIQPDYEICCRGVRHFLPDERKEDMQCCGKKLINRTSDICCRNPNYPELDNTHARYENIGCCGHLPLDRTKSQCYWNKTGFPLLLGMDEGLCDGRKINLRSQKCCFDQIYDHPHLNPEDIRQLNPRAACCGTKGFDPTKHKCCESGEATDSFLIQNIEEFHCCEGGSGGFINSTSQMCCDGHKVTKTSNYDQCCGSQNIDSRTEGCCNYQPFNKDDEFCCEGLPSAVMQKGIEAMCCDGRPLNKNNLCCDNTQVTKTNTTDDKCCLNHNLQKYKTYTSSKMDCYNGVVELRMTPGDSVCGDRRYIPTKATCCSETIHWFPEGETLGCCLGPDLTETVYNHKYQICCDGNVHNMSENEAECCYGKAYPKMSDDNPCTEKCGNTFHNKERTICCGRRVYEKKSDGDACCANQSYFSHNKTCCQDKLYHTTGGRCCGSQHYNHRTHTCCGSYMVIKRKSKSNQCCKRTMVYNKRHSTCQKNGLVELKKNYSALINICKTKTWKIPSGIELDVCFQTFAIECKILNKKFLKKSLQVEFTMKCKNLNRLMDIFHKSFAVQDKKIRLKMTFTSPRKVRCPKKHMKNKKVLIFLNKQATKISQHLYKLNIVKEDAFRLVQDSANVRQLIRNANSKEVCQKFESRLTREQKLAYFDTVW